MPAAFETDGVEFRVNTTTLNEQSTPWTAALPGGGYIITWSSDGQDGSGYGIYAQRYDASGNPIGGETRVNTTTTGGQDWSVVIALEGGGYVVVWASNGQDGSGEGIYAQRYDASGVAVGSETRVNTTTANTQTLPSVAALDGGGYVVAWQSLAQDGSDYGIYAQRYDSSGIALGGEFRVNSTTANGQLETSVATLSDGGFVITWHSLGQDVVGGFLSYGVYAQRYNSSGTAMGGETLINTTTSSDQEFPSVAALVGGGYVVTWMSFQDGSGWGIYAQRYDSSGMAQGGETRINTFTTNNQVYPAVAALADGGYVITWMSGLQDGGGWGIYAQAYDSIGAPVDGEIRINTTTASDQIQPVVAALEGGGFVITWASLGQDGSNFGIYAQQFAPFGLPSGTDATRSVAEDTSHVFSIGDFGFSDTNGNAFTGVVITTNPTDGRLALNGLWVNAGDFISAADIAAGNLIFAPHASENGEDYASFTFQVRDNGASNNTDTTPNTLTFDVSAVNDAPWATIGPTGYAPGGEETQVNSYTTFGQFDPSVAALAGGGHVVTWTSWQDAGSTYGIFAQRYDATGTPIGTETSVSSAFFTEQQHSSVAALEDGGYIVVWQAFGLDSDGYAIFAQRYDASGVAQGSEIPINTTVVDSQHHPSVAGLAGGGHVIVWVSDNQDGDSTGIYAQRFDSDGDPVGSETLVNTTTADSQHSPSVAATADGGYVVTWMSNGQDGSGWGIYAQRYDWSGAAFGTETLINTTTVGDQMNPSVAGLENGNYVIAWMDGSSGDTCARLFDASGLTVGDEFHVNTPGDSTSDPSITALDGGGFLVSWVSNEGGSPEIRAQAYDSWGRAVGDETAVNTTTANDQLSPSVAGLDGGGYLVTWVSDFQDGSGWGIYSQAFEPGIYATEQTPLSLLGSMSISDIDAGNGTLAATLSVNSGILNVIPGSSGALVSGSGTSSVTITGTLHQINALLTGSDWGSTVDYVAEGDWPPATANLEISVVDNGNSGSGFIGIGGSEATITISAVDDPPEANAIRSDFNGDGRSDVLWRSDSGQFSDWLATPSGGFANNDANAFTSVPTSWHVIGTGDFNGDGYADVLWRSDAGQLSDWLGTATGGFTNNDANAFTSVPTNWHVVGTGDFNGDGFDDILWRSDAGQLSDWLGQANGGFSNNDANAFTSVPTNWHVAGTGDFNNDGYDDILWRSDSGQLSNWLGNAAGGWVNNDANAFTSAPTSWHIAGTGDFNGDGHGDILWRSDAGQLSSWLGTSSGGWVNNDANAFTTVPTSWQVVAVGDYNGDGYDDILWRSDIGQLSNWLGTASGAFTNNDANAFTSAPTSWHTQPDIAMF